MFELPKLTVVPAVDPIIIAVDSRWLLRKLKDPILAFIRILVVHLAVTW